MYNCYAVKLLYGMMDTWWEPLAFSIWLESEEEPIEIVFKGADEESLNQSSTGCFSSPSSSLRFSVSALPKALTHDVTSLDSDTLANPDGDKNHVGNFTNMSPSNSGFLMQKVKFVRKGSRVEVRVWLFLSLMLLILIRVLISPKRHTSLLISCVLFLLI